MGFKLCPATVLVCEAKSSTKSHARPSVTIAVLSVCAYYQVNMVDAVCPLKRRRAVREKKAERVTQGRRKHEERAVLLA